MVLLVTMPLIAGNSVFSFYGMPYQYNGIDTYSMGMGDAGSADIFRFNTGYANPAQRNLSNRTLFSTGMLFGYTNYQSDTNGKQSYRDDSLDFPFFSLSVPLKSHRFGFQFHSLSSGVMTNSLNIEDENIIERHSMDRYLYRADLIYSYYYKNLMLGISGNYYLGHDIHRFAQEGGYGTFNTMEKLDNSYKNPSATLGAIYKTNMMAMGGYYSMGQTLKGDQVRSSIHETEDAIDYEFKIPDHINLSLTVIPIPEYKLALDLDYEPWSAISDDYVDSWKLSFGVAREPKQDQYRKSIRRFPVRAGFSYRKLPFTAVEDNEIDELNASLGVTIPLKRDVNRVDLGLRYTKRGSLATNQLQDDAIMFMVGFTGFDIMSKAPDRKAPRYIPEAEDLSR